tara:strand:+ start:155 stop:370 length:216 start_codon:yes stop_codon:yes gene_type:complete
MTHFNLNDLRVDVADHSDWFIFGFGDHDAMIDFIIEALIGSTEYQLLSDYPYARVRFIPVDQDTTLTLELS